jgi:hypothetical protein
MTKTVQTASKNLITMRSTDDIGIGASVVATLG